MTLNNCTLDNVTLVGVPKFKIHNFVNGKCQ